MFAEELLPKLRELAERACVSEGLILAWLELKRQRGGSILRVFIDRAGSEKDPALAVGLDDCERVTRHLSLLLDVEDPFDSSYTLEVSTPGLDRPLHDEADYRRFEGKLAIVNLRQEVDGHRRVVGRLRGVEAGVLLIEPTAKPSRKKRARDANRLSASIEGSGLVRIPIAAIESARLEVELSAPLGAAEHSVPDEAGGAR